MGSGSSAVLVALLSTLTAVAATLVTSWAARPKVKAEAGAAETAGQVSMSTDAREWVKEFRDAASAAEERASAAVARATAAEDRTEQLEDRMREVERKFDIAVGYIRTLQRDFAQTTGTTPHPPPLELIPPLSA